jgi:hypothetical protein
MNFGIDTNLMLKTLNFGSDQSISLVSLSISPLDGLSTPESNLLEQGVEALGYTSSQWSCCL